MNAPTICHSCGAMGPTKRFQFYENVGAIVVRFHRSISGDLCKPCATRYFWNFTGKTVLLGWWGVISFILTPLILLNNVIQFLRAIPMDTPALHSSEPPSPLWILASAGGFLLLAWLGLSLLAPLFQPIASPPQQPTARSVQSQALQPPAPTRRPTSRPLPSATPSCTHWQRVTSANIGRLMCVYGVVKRWYSTADFATVIRFSEDPGDLIFYDIAYTYDDLASGACVAATGVIENMGSRLAINIDGELYACD